MNHRIIGKKVMMINKKAFIVSLMSETLIKIHMKMN